MIELLYKKKIIRDFLSLFTENYWKQLISCIVEYGIINFKKHHNIASLTPEEIFQVVETLKKEENLSDKIKTNILQEKTKIKKNISRSRSKSNSNFLDNKSVKASGLLKSISTNFKINASSNNNSVEKNSLFKRNNSIKSKKLSQGHGHSNINSSPGRNSNTSNYDKNVRIRINSGIISTKKKLSDTLSSKSIKAIERTDSRSKKLINNFKNLEIFQSPSTKSSNKLNNILNNIKTMKNRTDQEENSLVTSNSTKSIVKKKSGEILEQVNLNKLKDKKKNKDEVNKSDQMNEKRKESLKKYKNVEYNIKGALVSDKKTNNLKKNTRNENDDKFNIQLQGKNENLSDEGNFNYNPNSNFNEINNTNPKSNILTLEERLNGLTKKVSNVERNSNKFK